MKRFCDRHERDYELMSNKWKCRKCASESARKWRQGKGKGYQSPNQSANWAAWKYGITTGEVVELRSKGRCDGCGTSEGVMCIDHSHETGKVRGLLCHHCNLILGHAKDNPQLLRMLADYLERN